MPFKLQVQKCTSRQLSVLGQALPKTMKDGQIISKESIQIEPLTRKGFPYALNDNGQNLKM